jgi:hypothetical protein
MVRKNKEFFKVVRCGTLEEVVNILNYYLARGWFVESLDEHRTEFFQEHTALLVSEGYLKNKKKYLSLIEGKRKDPFNVSLYNSK